MACNDAQNRTGFDAASVAALLRFMGDDPERAGLRETPERVLASLQFFSQGMREDPERICREALFPAGSHDLVLVKDIEFYSLCEHHLVPFYGKCHIAYVPDKWIVGLSKIGRVVDAFSRRLQVQESLTTDIADCLSRSVDAQGVAVVIEAYHLCMMMRGVRKQNATTLTLTTRGVFEQPDQRNQFLQLIR